MKTLFLYTDSDMRCFFFEKEGDYRRLHNLHVNSGNCPDDIGQEIVDILEDISDEERLDEPTKDWDFFANIGWIL